MDSHHVGYRVLQKKRTTNFREDETKLLIQLWGSPQVQNKLYLTHRKEPVMRLLAANMQQRGFYRTPDEIKTRIRNLKCLYHRIKRTVQSGSGIGTVDPDWPHYKAMDAVLSRQNVKSKESMYKENVFDGPTCDEIKQEIEDIDVNDDMESYTTNSMGGSEFDDEPATMPPLTPAPPKNTNSQSKPLPTILPNFTIPLPQSGAPNMKPASIPSLPFPLLILNGLQTNQMKVGEVKESTVGSNNTTPQNLDIQQILKELLEVQKENLNVEKHRLELEKQRLEFERFMGAQLLAIAPILTSIFQKLGDEDECDNNGEKKESKPFKDGKILKTLLSEGIKKYMTNAHDEEDSQTSDISEK